MGSPTMHNCVPSSLFWPSAQAASEMDDIERLRSVYGPFWRPTASGSHGRDSVRDSAPSARRKRLACGEGQRNEKFFFPRRQMEERGGPESAPERPSVLSIASHSADPHQLSLTRKQLREDHPAALLGITSPLGCQRPKKITKNRPAALPDTL
jgi:hypothetical protein